MELMEICRKTDGLFYPQREFVLVQDNGIVGRLMAMEIAEESRLDLTVIIIPKYRCRGYATAGLKMLIKWAAQNGYKKVTLTDLFGSETIDKMARTLHFIKEDRTNIWSKSITGPLNL